jgi:hypothetical protein
MSFTIELKKKIKGIKESLKCDPLTKSQKEYLQKELDWLKTELRDKEKEMAREDE